MPPANAFTCRRCGHCCQGKGGIVLASRDIERLCRHLDLDRNALLSRYTETVGELPRLICGADGFCVFFRDGCGVHQARPDVCRAWPFFRANLDDPGSFAMAAQDCPGIAAGVSHEEFARQGRRYLASQGLDRTGDGDAPHALTGGLQRDSERKDHGRPDLDAA